MNKCEPGTPAVYWRLVPWAILAVSVPCLAYATDLKSTGCKLESPVLTGDRPPIYISFERVEPKVSTFEWSDMTTEKVEQEVGPTIWFRLHNNTCWPVSVTSIRSPDNPRLVEIKLSNGTGLAVKDGEEVSVYYEGQPTRGKQPVSRKAPYHGLRSVWILPGKSVVFRVLRQHLNSSASISVYFGYEWEFEWKNGEQGEHWTSNKVSFHVSDLPTGIWQP